MWLVANLLVVITWFGIFAFNNEIETPNKIFHIIKTVFLGYALFFHGYAEPYFLIICAFVIFGIIITHLRNINKIIVKDFSTLYMTYIMLPFPLEMRIILLWAGVIE
ncbi:hypothetical protein [Erwinia tasmaniensis]|uniref:Uncharacterized protein n=1 Tax=Erwinia tasmaniensis (strain DSM 17950 / CFBP 7177 / CIP 109463 / NCPPB 4357 / Et1/99) TaxID=465817 RepID=B2VF30_ERWT9|nr:hypothetical protein [Erwinia tasmaniensis]CAO97867.1 hypothetical protein ETA_28210 [Erwinia tasmaniensis Et1/99]